MNIFERFTVRFMYGLMVFIGVCAIILIPLCMINFSNFVPQWVSNIVGYGTMTLAFIIALVVGIYSGNPFGAADLMYPNDTNRR